ncbi:MAG: FAD-dependent monooxygenase [Alphaproteobacteria bacterium]|nr:FAD-dependent monooxygenase [Alphaproteobacteria bacterium]MBU1279921.1 FAD-dependent monooxygenase [Alphaproteobacteria bacterium]MBU1575060.1 FAD-dependent monooxygenase [Alphaproteobacteria bacterium]MBU1827237.1 FAD-dependent monooxygenase [Alphaproteobacteria bacterium]MBU2078847.1 FAD-dependent monooxygenase [Alphaproteobacteria bacterium]
MIMPHQSPSLPPRETVDVLVSGGGIAGMIAAAAFGASGFKTLMIDPTPPITSGTEDRSDLRSTAFLRPARDLFARIGIWDALAPHATPLEALRIVDTLGQPSDIRAERQFEGRETGDEPFGWNFLNWVIRRELLKALPNIPNVEMRYGTGFKSMLTRTNEAIVTLTDGAQLRAKLVVAADGRNSPVREAAGIGVKTTRYGQKSLAFTATHDLPHHNVSTEIYREGGPFTMVPLADIDGKPASAIVWMNKGPYATELLTMEPEAFNAVMTTRSAGLFGQLTLASGRAIFPIITQVAERLSGERVAVIAEAAHVLPPIGAQGLNTSLNDLAELLALAEAHRTDVGGQVMLDAYAKTRHRDITARAKVVDVFNRVTRSESDILQALRLLGLKAVHDVKPLRQGIMKAGLGPI